MIRHSKQHHNFVHLHCQDEELLNDACSALVTICDVSADNIQLVMEQGIVSR
jgi:hypothetical protein